VTGVRKNSIIWHITVQKNMRYKNIKATKRIGLHQVQLLNKNADRSARLTVLLKAASELKSTIAEVDLTMTMVTVQTDVT